MSKPTQTWFGWQEWILVMSAIAIAIGVVAILSPAFRNFVADSTTANWAAAIGSLAAACAAVWAATFAVRQQRLRERISAALSVRTLRPDIEHIKKELVGIRNGIQKAATSKSRADPKIESKKRLLENLKVKYAASEICIDAAAAGVEIDTKAIQDVKYRLEDQLVDVANDLRIEEANSRTASTEFNRQQSAWNSD
ncbi:hypothetical protein G6F65_019784 [Rhizopus arrhizus]|nr:hypothetical protein G6F65_019784 [Rhizopus arrhizus]